VKVVSVLVLSGVLCAGGIAAGVQLKGAATSVTGEYTAALEEPHARIINEFSELAGSEANARSLVAGLRQGSEITLTVPAKGGQPGMATRFTPPTRPLDYGDVRISLALARGQLAQLGIDRPTPTQIKAVLAGGGVATRVSGQATTRLGKDRRHHRCDAWTGHERQCASCSRHAATDFFGRVYDDRCCQRQERTVGQTTRAGATL
jgi:hypothetical protein